MSPYSQLFLGSHHFLANKRGKRKSSDRFSFSGLQNHCGWWRQAWNCKMFASWKESYNKSRQCIKKQRHHFANKGLYKKAMVFPVVMYRCESRTIKKAEHWRIDAFKLWCCRRLLRVPWIARRSTLNIHWKDWCWSSNTLAIWCEEPTHWKGPWC